MHVPRGDKGPSGPPGSTVGIDTAAKYGVQRRLQFDVYKPPFSSPPSLSSLFVVPPLTVSPELPTTSLTSQISVQTMAPFHSLKRRRAPSDELYTSLASKPHSQDVLMFGQLPWASSLVLDHGSADTDVGRAQTISFAPNVTPKTFTAPPPTDEDDVPSPLRSSLFPDPADVHLNPPAAGACGPVAKRRRKGGSKTKLPSSSASTFASSPPSSSRANSPCPGANGDGSSPAPAPEPAHIPRPPNAFILFRSSFIRSQHISAATEGNHGTLSKIVGMLWHALSYEERQVWQGKARRALAEHRRMYPGYSFRPTKEKIAAAKERVAAAREKESEKEKEKPVSVAVSSSRKHPPAKDAANSMSLPAATTEAPKRRTRVVGPRDLARCERIATLLARGLKGVELDAAMREFDATRIPAPFTATFEEPLTAQVYEGRANGSNTRSVKVEETAPETEARREGGKVEAQMQKQQRPALPLRAVRRSSSAPLLDAEATAIGRRQSAFMPAPPGNSPTAPHAYQFFQDYEQHSENVGQHAEAQPVDLQMHAPMPARAARKRSASSSPPVRPRALPTHLNHFPYLRSRGSYSSMAFSAPARFERYMQTETEMPNGYSIQYDFAMQQQQQHVQHQQPFGLQLDTSFPQAQNMYPVQPRTAHPLSRQPTEILFDSNESAIESTSTSTSEGSWYNASESSGSSMSSTGNVWDARGLDFSSFSFTNPHPNSGAETPVSAHLIGASEGYSPFDHVPLTPASTEIDYAGMPTLIEQPTRHLLTNFAHQQQDDTVYSHHQQSHHPHQPLVIQTSWSSSDFDFEVPPSSAVSGVFDCTPSSANASTYDFSDAALSPTSAYALPSSPGESDAPLNSPGAHTPCDDIDVRNAWGNAVETRDLGVGDMGLGIGVNIGMDVDVSVDVSADVRGRLVSLFAHAEKLGVPRFAACTEDSMDGEMSVGFGGAVDATEFGAFARFMTAGANRVV
ncbi:hypothetical protein EW145_g4836 [Phellinidium pouzarii]|uniref:HMG box domain-containing protein n=1 Tax=Phellinidium pouzarii TaxID=167371 RepID=A0A4S4L3Z2_9AGAM|nr:hypothetical protein EW145_g4836 [Phellinidium pouzarii]